MSYETYSEKLQPVELGPQYRETPETAADGSLTAEHVEQLYAVRRSDLKSIKPGIGLKFYYRAAEKIKQEEEALKRLLRLENAKQNILSEYSFVLDPVYFEQKFLSN